MEKLIPIKYKETNIDCGFRADFVVGNSIILELKTTEKILPIHEAPLLTYLKLSKKKLGIILNFNMHYLKNDFLICIILTTKSEKFPKKILNSNVF